MVEKTIEAAYEVALKIGIENANALEKEMFKKLLYQIAIQAIDEVRTDISSFMSEKANKYIK